MFRLFSEEYIPIDITDDILNTLQQARWEVDERIKKKFSRQILLCETLSELSDVYEEMNREASVYGNF
jgi:hypothetical protein